MTVPIDSTTVGDAITTTGITEVIGLLVMSSPFGSPSN